MNSWIRRTFHKLSIAAAASVAAIISVTAFAGPLKPQHVPADADWVAHIDMHGLANSTLVKAMLDHAAELKVNIDGIKGMKEQYGIDPMTDIKEITVHGFGTFSGDEPLFVATIVATPAVDDFVNMLKAQGEGYSEVQLNGRTISVFDGGDEKIAFQLRKKGEEGDRVIVLSKDQAKLSRALDVIDGKSPSLVDSSSVLNKKSPRSGAYIYAAATRAVWGAFNLEDDEDAQPMSAVVKDAQTAVFEFGETGEDMFMELQVGTATDEAATNLGDIMRGFAAMGRLATANDPNLAPAKQALEAVKVKTNASLVTLSWQQNTQSVLENVKKLATTINHDEDDENEDDEDDGHASIKVEVKAKSKPEDTASERKSEKKPQ